MTLFYETPEEFEKHYHEVLDDDLKREWKEKQLRQIQRKRQGKMKKYRVNNTII
jgi:hypothetical protein